MNYLISGGGSGIGRAISIHLAEKGHNCYILGRNAIKLKETISLLKEGNHKYFEADVRNKEELAAILKKNQDLVLDGIIANAGLGGENQFGDDDRWYDIVDTNLTGTYHTVESFLPALKKSKNEFKQVLIISSVLARLGVANYAAYCASKAGLLGLMRSWAVQYAGDNILVNAICPGWVDTDMAQDGLQGIADGLGVSKAEFYKMAMKSVPLGKMSDPEEVAVLVSYLLQQKSITGQTIDINNGAIMNS